MRKYLSLLFFFGLAIATAGIVMGKVSGVWTNVSIALTVSGWTMMVMWLGLWLKFNQKLWRLRLTESLTNATLATIAVLAILGMINFLAFRYQVRIDFTETKIYTLSSLSQQTVAKLPQKLEVYLFERQPNNLDRQLLENYQRNSPNFSYQVVNPQENLSLTQEFNVQEVGEVYLRYNGKKQLLQTISPNTRLSESLLTQAIAKIQQEKQFTVYILQGHGEPTLDDKEGNLGQSVKALEDQGYIVKPLLLALNLVTPPDADIIIITTPQKRILPQEVKTLNTYLEKGGKLLVMLNAQSKSGIESILQSWGINLDERLLVDASGTGTMLGLGAASTIINDYGSHPITKDFNGISVYPLARGINTIKKDKTEAIAILITNEQTWAESDLKAEAVEFNENEDIKGPIDLGVALKRQLIQPLAKKEEKPLPKENNKKELLDETKEKKNDSTLPQPPSPQIPGKTQLKESQSKESKIVMIGNSNFITNGWFEQQLNGDVFLNTVNWLADDQTQVLSIRPRESKNRRLNLTSFSAGLLGWLALVIIPVLGFIASIFTFWQRR